MFTRPIKIHYSNVFVFAKKKKKFYIVLIPSIKSMFIFK